MISLYECVIAHTFGIYFLIKWLEFLSMIFEWNNLVAFSFQNAIHYHIICFAIFAYEFSYQYHDSWWWIGNVTHKKSHSVVILFLVNAWHISLYGLVLFLAHFTFHSWYFHSFVSQLCISVFLWLDFGPFGIYVLLNAQSRFCFHSCLFGVYYVSARQLSSFVMCLVWSFDRIYMFVLCYALSIARSLNLSAYCNVSLAQLDTHKTNY